MQSGSVSQSVSLSIPAPLNPVPLSLLDIQSPAESLAHPPSPLSCAPYLPASLEQTVHDSDITPSGQAILSNISEPIPLPPSYLMCVQTRARDRIKNEWILVDIIIDTGGQRSFIDKALVQRLSPTFIDQYPMAIAAFGSDTPGPPRIYRRFLVDLVTEDHDILSLPLFECESITIPISRPTLSDDDCEYLRKRSIILKKDDRAEFHSSILIGVDNKHLVAPSLTDILLPSGLSLSKTRLGPTIYGSPFHFLPSIFSYSRALSVVFIKENDDSPLIAIDNDQTKWIENLWKLDTIGITEDPGIQSPSDIKAQDLARFHQSVVFRDGVPFVSFPFKKDPTIHLNNNERIARAVLNSTCSSYQKLSVWNDLDKIFREQIATGILEMAPNIPDGPVYYLPHHPVFTPSKTHTKIRVVMNASSHEKGKYSLNDLIDPSSNLVPDLVGVLLRAQLFPFLIISDVAKAFHCIRLLESQRDCTRLLWLRDPSQPPTPCNLLHLRHTRVPFGINASPYILAAIILYFYDNLDKTSPDSRTKSLIAQLRSNTYVDNIVVGLQDTDEGSWVYKTLKSLFNSMNMNLRDFISNSSSLNESIPNADRSMDNDQKLLGILWNTVTDVLTFGKSACSSPKKRSKSGPLTKRTTLREMMSIYDPLGYLAPLIIRLRLFHQSLWKRDYGWDDPLSETEVVEWRRIFEQCAKFQFSRPRYLFRSLKTPALISLFVFTDASASAFSACCYIADAIPSPSSPPSLLMGKARLAPLQQTVSIPRMELIGLLCGARLARFVSNNIPLQISQINIFSDSLIVLQQLRACKIKNPFVENQLDKIKAINNDLPVTPSYFHVPTDLNPADCASRGVSPDELPPDHIWWNGPLFLQASKNKWPTIPISLIPEEIDKIDEQLLCVPNKRSKAIPFSSETKVPVINCNVCFSPSSPTVIDDSPSFHQDMMDLDKIQDEIQDETDDSFPLLSCPLSQTNDISLLSSATLLVSSSHSSTPTNSDHGMAPPAVDSVSLTVAAAASPHGLNIFSSLVSNISRYSIVLRSVSRVVRALNYFFRNSPHYQARFHQYFGPLPSSPVFLASELCNAEALVIRMDQKTHPPSVTADAQRLVPDSLGMLRFHSRIQDPSLPDSFSNPIILSKSSPLVPLIVRHYHLPLHIPRDQLIMRVRERFSIPSLGRAIRTCISKCLRCQRFNNHPVSYPIMPDLPTKRIICSRSFEHSALDYMGPFSIRGSAGSIIKSYILLFTCLVTRAVHLEVTEDLSTTLFLHAFKRFIARRGVPSTITSDNGSQIVLGEKLINSLWNSIPFDPTVVSFLQKDHTKPIAWHFNTPAAPWKGGVFERLVKSVKLAFHKSLASTIPRFEDFSTLVIEIEASLNSRPLTSMDGRDYCLRPIDLLFPHLNISSPLFHDPRATLSHIPDPQQTPQARTANSSLAAMETIRAHVFHLFVTSYLSELRDMYLKLSPSPSRTSASLSPSNFLYLLRHPTRSKCSYPLVKRVGETVGPDGFVREISILLPSGKIIKRPPSALIPLELDFPEPTSLPLQPHTRDDDRKRPTRSGSPHPHAIHRSRPDNAVSPTPPSRIQPDRACKRSSLSHNVSIH